MPTYVCYRKEYTLIPRFNGQKWGNIGPIMLIVRSYHTVVADISNYITKERGII